MKLWPESFPALNLLPDLWPDLGQKSSRASSWGPHPPGGQDSMLTDMITWRQEKRVTCPRSPGQTHRVQGL